MSTAKTIGAKNLLRQHFLSNIGRVMQSNELREAAGGINEWGRRVRELRAEGYMILTHNDRTDLSPGEYLLEDPTPRSIDDHLVDDSDEMESFGTVSLIRQGDHRFYSLTMPSTLLAETCFIISRDEDPKVGFQRVLDKKRAQEIAQYIDSGLGTIPSAIVLSAQDCAELSYDSKKKSIAFNRIPKAFLILDGQHRVYGFSLAKTAMRIPVVIYEGLSRRDETRLFIDINSKQKGVPPELLLDIKKLAEYENTQEEFMREIYDSFIDDSASILYGRLSPTSRTSGKISRTTFNSAVKPLLKIFGGKSVSEIYGILNGYLVALDDNVLRKNEIHDCLFTSTVFKALCAFFPIVATKVKDRFGAIYTPDNFSHFLIDVGDRVKPARFQNTNGAYTPLLQHLEDSLSVDFTL